MTPADWERLDALLDAAFDLPPDEQRAYLDAQNLPDRLRQRAEAMLAADAADSAVLDAPERLGELFDAATGPESLPPGTIIGPYRVVREIGRGGMGTVVLAERADGAFEKRVALKLVRAGLADGLLARFRAERRILARLEHPGIARLLDGGTADDGRPFLAMEYVEGEPITAYSDRHHLGVEARLALFAQVCDAVAYAHRQLVVHRDLKPSNILVETGAEGTPTVKLLDFGIAKLLETDADVALVETAPEQRLLTPAYAAPEQVRGETPSTATDVYALGVLLYELLTGRRPFHLDERARHAVERAILEAEPTRPSTAVTESGEETQTLAASRQTEPARLRRQLAGDLDHIVLMALRKEPERRYDSAAAFGRDVRRHLDRLPVEARPDAWGYRASRFVRRHRAAVAAVAVALAGLVGGLGAALVQADRAAEEQDRAAAARDEARAVADFMSDLFDAAKPRVAQGEAITARQLLDTGAEEIRDDLTRHPSTRAALLLEIGKAYVSMGEAATADTLLREALRLRQRAVQDARTPAEQRDATLGLAATHYEHGATLDLLERYDAAEAAYVRAVDTYRPVLAGADHAGLAEALADLGTVRAWATGTPAGAVPLLDESRAMYRRLFARDPASAHLRDMVAYSTGSLGIVRQEAGDSTAAETLYREAIAFLRDHGATESPTLLDNQYMLATLLANTGRSREAESVFREMIPLEARVLGETNPAHASTLYTLADLLRHRGAHREAADLYERAGAIRAGALGPEHPSVLRAMHRQGAALHAAGDGEAGRARLAEAVGVCRRTGACAQAGNRDADFLAALLADYGRALADAGREAEAHRALAEAADLHRQRGETEDEARLRAALQEI